MSSNIPELGRCNCTGCNSSFECGSIHAATASSGGDAFSGQLAHPVRRFSSMRRLLASRRRCASSSGKRCAAPEVHLVRGLPVKRIVWDRPVQGVVRATFPIGHRAGRTTARLPVWPTRLWKKSESFRGVQLHSPGSRMSGDAAARPPAATAPTHAERQGRARARAPAAGPYPVRR
jgi:hypothetical protein